MQKARLTGPGAYHGRAMMTVLPDWEWGHAGVRKTDDGLIARNIG